MDIPHVHLHRSPAHDIHQVTRPKALSKPGSYRMPDGMKNQPVTL